jgi:isopropylmalate/homocitrate/citramalate synthase
MALAATAPLELQVLADPAYAILAAVAALISGSTVLMLWRAPRIDRPLALHAHQRLVVERVILAGAFLTAAAPAAEGFGLLGASLLVTIVAQRMLRARHELGAAGGRRPTGRSGLTADQIIAFVDAQLAVLAAEPPLAGLRGWNRAITIELTEPDLRIYLVAVNGGLTRVPQPPDEAGVRIDTTGPVFEDIFLRDALSPRQAVLSRRVRTQAKPRDLLHINLLFNEFRRLAAAETAPVRGATLEVAERSRPAAEVPGLPEAFVLSDTTLRDGEQAPGVAFDRAEKLELARALARLGVPLIEVGFPAVSGEELAAVQGIVDDGLDAVIQVIARPLEHDIDLAVASGAHSIAVFVGTSDSHVVHKLRTDRAGLLRRVREGVAYAKNSGRQVVFAAEDATRTEPVFLAAVACAAAEAGADAIGLADTVGIATPWSMRAMVRVVSEACDLPIAVHCHDDLGLATANSLAALTAGASGVQCSVLGIGERAGNAGLEQVALAIEAAWGRGSGLDLRALTPLAERVAALTGQAIAPGRPVVGRNAFLHESGLHTSGIVRDPATYEPYPPEWVGRERGFAVGKHSGRSGVAHVLALHGVALPDPEMAALLDEIKGRTYRGAPLGEPELLAMVRSAAPVGAPTGPRGH